MIGFILFAAATSGAVAAPPTAPAIETRFTQCVAIIDTDPERAIEFANKWRIENGGISARRCLGLAYSALERWAAAATVFEQVAQDAEVAGDVLTAYLWVQAGNAALASGNAVKARAMLDAGISRATLTGVQAGEAHLDRARALAALSDNKAARADLDKALMFVPADPLVWLLSATLARRSGDLARAATDIHEAAKRSPDDASVALEAGNIAILSGSDAAAKTAWEAAVTLSPTSDSGKAAAAALMQLRAAPAP